jgi:drug/metabolite transporter (DMT)-like permease
MAVALPPIYLPALILKLSPTFAKILAIQTNNSFKAHAGLLFTNLFFAINYTAVKHLANNGYIGPFGLNAIRVGVSVALFWLLFLASPGKPGIQRQHIGRFLLCAVTGVAINQLLFIKGLSMTYSIHASLLILITPILITVFAAVLLREKVTGAKVLGLLLGIGGALVLVLKRPGGGAGSDVLLGDIFIIVNAISYTFYFVLVKPLMAQYSAVHVIRWVFTLGLPMVLPFGWQELGAVQWPGFGTMEWVALGLVVFCGTFLAYLFNAYGIKVLGASVAGAYIYTQPILAAAIAMLVLGEPLEPYKLLAAGLIFAGVYLANKTAAK